MSKKEFASGLDQLLLGSNSKMEERKPEKVKDMPEDKEIRATFIVHKSQLETIKALAYWQRKQLKQIIQESLNLYIHKIGKVEMDNALEAFNKNEIF